MLKSMKKTVLTAVTMAMMIGVVAVSAAVYATDDPISDYKVFAEIPGSNVPQTEVDRYNGVTVWIGGGNVKSDINGIELRTNNKFAQLYLYHNMTIPSFSGSPATHDDFTNITNGKGVLWAISTDPYELTFDKDNKLAKSESATINKGKITAGKIATDYDNQDSDKRIQAYAIAYQMKMNGAKPYKFTEEDGRELGVGYTILAAVKIEVRHAATSVSVFKDKFAVQAFEESGSAKYYKTTGTPPSAGVPATETESDAIPLKKATAVTLGVNETVELYVSGIAGTEKTAVKKAIPADPLFGSYTISIIPNKTGIEYVKLLSDSGAEVNSIKLGQNELMNGFKIKGTAIAPKISKDGSSVTAFTPSKATVLITNNQSGKSARVVVTVTNSASITTSIPSDVLTIDAPYNKVATYTFDLIDGFYADTTGSRPAGVLSVFNTVEVTDRTPGSLVFKEGTETDSSKHTYEYKLFPYFTINKTEQIVIKPGTVDEEINDVPDLPLLSKPVTAVYVPNSPSDVDDANKFENTIIDAFKAVSKSRAVLPKVVIDTTPYQTAKGFRASIAKDNSTLTLTIPKTGFADNDNKPKDIYLAVAYSTDAGCNIIVQKITINPKTAKEMPLSVSPAIDGFSGITVTEGKLTDSSYIISGAIVNTEYTVSLSNLPLEADGKFTLIKGLNTTINGNKVKAIKPGNCTFKIKVGSFIHTITLSATLQSE